MNLNKSREFFDPETLERPIHIIGCGAVGSTIAENLARLGVKEIHLWDFDTVEEHNLANQMFQVKHLNMLKTDAVEDICKSINPDITIIKHEAYTDESLSGYIFICPDSIKVRRAILETNLGNGYISGVFDGRMRLTDAQHFASSWETLEKRKELLNTMNFSDTEAKEATPVSACGTSLSVCFTVRCLVSLMIANFINTFLGNPIQKMITIDLKNFIIDCFQDK
jgi:hypothetical protein